MSKHDKQEHLERSLSFLMARFNEDEHRTKEINLTEINLPSSHKVMDEETRWKYLFILIIIIFIGILLGLKFAYN